MPETLTLPDWTEATPTVPGMYRFRGEWHGLWIGKVKDPVWCEVWFHVKPRIGQVWFFGNGQAAYLASANGEWQGPIKIVRESEETHGQ